MRSKIIFLSLVVGAMMLSLWWNESTEEIKQGSTAKFEAMSETQLEKIAQRSPQSSSAADPVALKSLADMSRTLREFSQAPTRIHDLVDYLRRTRQDPKVVADRNPYTGEMAIVRTANPLPHTRYFHAQYFSGGDEAGFMQHMSFEFKPSPDAFAQAVRSVQDAFGLGEPKFARDGYAQWSLDESGYIVWVKKLSLDELRDDPFNSYTEKDVNTVRVAIEAEIHGDDDGH
jgi:hypothetical protein